MDYLDPIKKKQHRRRLFIGYGLMAIVIALMTTILIYLGSGFYVDRQTGDLIQNGQILVASNPEGASVYLNNKQQRTKTTGKLVVPSGSYSLSVRKDGYRDWNQQVALEGGKILRLDYLKLIPTDLKTNTVQSFASAPIQIVQSPDRRYVAMTFADKPLSITILDLIKTEEDPLVIDISASQLADQAKTGQITLQEWASDNRHILLEHQLAGVTTDYIMGSRDKTDSPVNISTKFNLKDVSVRMQAKNKDKFFVYSASQKTLSVINSGESAPTVRIANVLQYSAYDNDTILYATPSTDPTKTEIRLTEGLEKTYLIRELSKQPQYLMDISKLGSTVVAAVGASAENRVTILRNPIGYLKSNPTAQIPLATTIFILENPTEVSFSPDASVVMTRGGRKIATHFFEEDKSTRFVSPLEIESSRIDWLDSMHLSVTAKDGYGYMMDFDGSNTQKLVQNIASYPLMFDSNFRNMYSFGGDSKPFFFNKTSLLVAE